MDATRPIQYLIFFSTALGIVFLLQVYTILPSIAFDFVTAGWVMFLVASLLTFIRPRASRYLALVLAAIALAAEVGDPAHYGVLQGGNPLAVTTLIVGGISQALLVVMVLYHVLGERRKDEWAWPGAESQA